MQRRIAFLLALPLLMTACSSSSNSHSSGSSSSPSGALSGNWQMTLQSSDPKAKPLAQSGFLLQTGNAVTGSVIVSNSSCSGIASVSGNVNGSDISLEINPTGTVINQTGTISGQSMSGNYSILSTGCSGTHDAAPQSGTWTASLVTPLSGNLQGTYTSNRLGPFAVTGQVSQGPNTGISNATLSGSLSVPGYCFTAANITGAVSGTSVVMNLVDTDGTQVGEIIGTSSLDGTSLTGTLKLIGLGQSARQGCKSSDSGTITLTL
jgi:hypothetical protein